MITWKIVCKGKIDVQSDIFMKVPTSTQKKLIWSQVQAKLHSFVKGNFHNAHMHLYKKNTELCPGGAYIPGDIQRVCYQIH